MTTSHTVQELSRWQTNTCTYTPTNSRYWKQYHLRYAVAGHGEYLKQFW